MFCSLDETQCGFIVVILLGRLSQRQFFTLVCCVDFESGEQHLHMGLYVNDNEQLGLVNANGKIWSPCYHTTHTWSVL